MIFFHFSLFCRSSSFLRPYSDSTWSADPPPSAESCSPALTARSRPQCHPDPAETQQTNVLECYITLHNRLTPQHITHSYCTCAFHESNKLH